MSTRVKLATFVPIEDADMLRQVLGDSGAGTIGEYSYCSFSVVGKGRFLPSASAKPHIGTIGALEAVDEERIEIVCERKDAKRIIEIMKQNHPYEEVAFDIYPLLDEDEL